MRVRHALSQLSYAPLLCRHGQTALIIILIAGRVVKSFSKVSPKNIGGPLRPPDGLGKNRRSTLTLVVGLTLGLGGPGLLGGKGQHHQGDHIGQHPVNVAADSQLGQPVDPIAVDV